MHIQTFMKKVAESLTSLHHYITLHGSALKSRFSTRNRVITKSSEYLSSRKADPYSFELH